MEPFLKLVHRDDLDPDVLAALEAAHPGAKIVCAGDAPGGVLPPDVAEIVRDLERRHAESIAFGRCIDCGATMPGYPELGRNLDSWQPVAGRMVFTNLANGNPMAWQCPACDAAESED